jgi:hypothetical protein
MSFTDRNLPSRQPAGPKIPQGVRKSILAVMSELGFDPAKLFALLARRHGYGSLDEVIEDLKERFSEEEAAHFAKEMSRVAAEERLSGVVVTGHNPYAEPALLALPEALFLDAVEYGFEAHSGYGGGFPETIEINALLERRGIFFRVNRWGRFEWVGDPGAWKEVTEPALAALQDPRLAGARNEFEAARAHLRRGSSKDLEDAVEEAGKSVESAMKVLLDESGVARKGNEAAFKLFELLRDNGVVEAEADQAVLGVARIRNKWGGHGAGQAPRNPPSSLAELTVQEAAVAIVFLSSRL